MSTKSHRRTTACISEAFSFLSTPEYNVNDEEATGPYRDTIPKTFDISLIDKENSTQDRASIIVRASSSIDSIDVVDSKDSEYTIVTYLDNNEENSSPSVRSQCDSGFIQEASFDDEVQTDEYRIETYLEDINNDKVTQKDNTEDREDNSITDDNTVSVVVSESESDMDGVVVLRHWPDSSKLDLNVSRDSDSEKVPSDPNVPKRGTQRIVSDAFSFLKEIEDCDDENERTQTDSNIPVVLNGDSDLNNGIKNLSVLPSDRCSVDSKVDVLSRKSLPSSDLSNRGPTWENSENVVRMRPKSGTSSMTDKRLVSTESSNIVNRRQKSGTPSVGGNSERQQNSGTPSMGGNSDDSSDEDTGIYNESFRNSCWVQVDKDHLMDMEKSSALQLQPSIEEKDEDVFQPDATPNSFISHNRSYSTQTTLSESEFRNEYQIKRRAFVQRHDSQEEYHRMSTRFYDQERVLTIVKGKDDQDFGLHVLDSHPAVITSVDKGSPSERGGVTEGQILIAVNGVNVLKANHQEIIQLIQKKGHIVQLEVASSDVYHVRNMDTPLLTGYMSKLSGSTFMKNWRRRYFILRPDNCLYYYKTEQDQDPLGALPLLNYLVSRHIDSNKENCFKAEKFGARTYFFMTDTREEMARWVSALNEAATKAKKKRDNWMDVTSHNVGIPALEIRKPDCSGYLSKCGRTMKGWNRRYCVLKDACMYYYKNMNSQSAQGMTHLHGYMIDQAGIPSKKNSISLRPPEPQMRTFTFCADNETDKRRWIAALSRSIQRWIKVD
ncbi:hypothetical protein FSP39_011044 [Pinctada imbricata]|uniref:Uncharacterized protein n=1 Tax=Pinctada imbricata TaxID=66713 RepID=A0AA88XLU2_PINIB|nr:hypothetical protein FSP39_011044 [Pinctada imbricata]